MKVGHGESETGAREERHDGHSCETEQGGHRPHATREERGAGPQGDGAAQPQDRTRPGETDQ